MSPEVDTSASIIDTSTPIVVDTGLVTQAPYFQSLRVGGPVWYGAHFAEIVALDPIGDLVRISLCATGDVVLVPRDHLRGLKHEEFLARARLRL